MRKLRVLSSVSVILLTSISTTKASNLTVPVSLGGEALAPMEAYIQHISNQSVELNTQALKSSYLVNKIQELQSQNAELRELLADAQSKYSGQDTELLNKVNILNHENERLKEALVKKQSFLDQKISRNNASDLEKQISKLQSQNRDLAFALAEATVEARLKAKEGRQNAGAFSSDDKVVIEKMNSLRQEIAALKDRNMRLESDLKKTSQILTEKNDARLGADIESLKKQNESLRETIKAQSGLLRSADNAKQAAERLISENLRLKKKLEQAGRATDMNTQTARQLFDENKVLRANLAVLEKNLATLQGEKEQLTHKLENAQFSSTQINENMHNSHFQGENIADIAKSLQLALDKERAITIEYRKKIREFQKEIQSLRSASSEVAKHERNYELSEDKAENKTSILNTKAALSVNDYETQNTPSMPAAEDLLSQGPMRNSISH